MPMRTNAHRDTFDDAHDECNHSTDGVRVSPAQAEAESFALESTERLWALVTFKDGPHQYSGLTDYTIRCAGRAQVAGMLNYFACCTCLMIMLAASTE